MKKMCAWLLCIMMLFSAAATLAEAEEGVLTIRLHEATDEELQEALSLIKAEQRSRLATKVVVEPAEIMVAKGGNTKVDASVTDLPEGVKAGEYAWVVSDESVASFNRGTVKGLKAGETLITCTCTLSDGTEVSGECKVTVVIPVQTLKAKANKIETMAGEVFQPEFTVTPEDATNQEVLLESSDEAVVKPTEDGQLQAVGVGKAVVTATTRDGSKKSAKINVTVTRKVGKYDDELRFQDLEWGADYETCIEKLKSIGFVDAEKRAYAYNTSYPYVWPEEDILFNTSVWNNLPVIFQDKQIGLSYSSLDPQKKVGGYTPNSANLYYTNEIGSDGNVNGEATHLIGVYFQFDNKHEPGSEIFRNLMAKMEEQYGEFTKYMHKSMTRRYYKDVYDGIAETMKDAKQFDSRTLKDRDIYMDIRATGVLHGKNNTGIMLSINSSGYVTLYYGKTDAWDQIHAIQKVLEAEPDTQEDAGV